MLIYKSLTNWVSQLCYISLTSPLSQRIFPSDPQVEWMWASWYLPGVPHTSEESDPGVLTCLCSSQGLLSRYTLQLATGQCVSRKWSDKYLHSPQLCDCPHLAPSWPPETCALCTRAPLNIIPILTPPGTSPCPGLNHPLRFTPLQNNTSPKS